MKNGRIVTGGLPEAIRLAFVLREENELVTRIKVKRWCVLVKMW